MRRKIFAALAFSLCAGIALVGCGEEPKAEKPAAERQGAQGAAVQKVAELDLSQTKDGTFQGESSQNSEYGHGKIAIAIENHKIVSATYFGIDKDGKIKGEDYGKKDGQIVDEKFYKKAQNSVKANAKYGAQLVERQQPGKVDAISGATISYEQFVEATTKAVEEAKK